MIVWFGKSSFRAETGERLVNQPLSDGGITSQLASQAIVARAQCARPPAQENTGGDSRFDPRAITKHTKLKDASWLRHRRQGWENHFFAGRSASAKKRTLKAEHFATLFV